MKIDIDVFKDWHPWKVMCTDGKLSEFKALYFKPDFSNNTLSYVVSVRKFALKITEDFEFTDLSEAIECYNNL